MKLIKYFARKSSFIRNKNNTPTRYGKNVFCYLSIMFFIRLLALGSVRVLFIRIQADYLYFEIDIINKTLTNIRFTLYSILYRVMFQSLVCAHYTYYT